MNKIIDIHAHLGGRSRYVSRRASKPRRVICNCNIIIDGFGNSNDADILVLTNLINTSARIHGSVSTV